jgi:hypothetical protein
MTEPDPYLLADLAEDVCLAENPEGFLCVEKPDHDGWHRATGTEGELYATWRRLPA